MAQAGLGLGGQAGFHLGSLGGLALRAQRVGHALERVAQGEAIARGVGLHHGLQRGGAVGHAVGTQAQGLQLFGQHGA